MQATLPILQTLARGPEPALRLAPPAAPTSVAPRESAFDRLLARADADYAREVDRPTESSDVDVASSRPAPPPEATEASDNKGHAASETGQRDETTSSEAPVDSDDASAEPIPSTEAHPSAGEAQDSALPAQDVRASATTANTPATLNGIPDSPKNNVASPHQAGLAASADATTARPTQAPVTDVPLASDERATVALADPTKNAASRAQPIVTNRAVHDVSTQAVALQGQEATNRPAQSTPTTETIAQTRQSPAQTAIMPAESTPQNNDHQSQQQSPRQGDGRFISTRPGASPALSPAGAGVLEVESNVQLTNLTGQPADGAARAVQVLETGAPTTVVQPGSADLTVGRESAVQLPQTSAATEGDRFSGRIVRGLSAMVNQRGGVMTMRLDPPELGQLRIQMTIVQGVVTAEFHAANEQARALLDRNLAVLRTSLENSGLTVERLHVSAGHPGQHADARDSGHQSDAQQREQQEHNAGGRESRGRREHDGAERRNWRQNLSEQIEFAMPESDHDLQRQGAETS